MFVHVGLPKTGTTHVQGTLAANRDKLAEQGLLYPRAPRHPQHFLPVLDFLQVGFGAVTAADVAGLWRQLVDSVEAWDGRALVSHELLAGATTDDVARLVTDFAPRDVHAIVTVRDMSRLLPAVWQERAKNRVVESWSEFRGAVARGPAGPEPHDFWKLHDVERVLDAWRPHVPDQHIHVITVPPSGSDPGLLVDRVAQVLAVDPTDFVIPEDAANASIGALELAVLREVNAVARRRIDRATYQATVKRFLVPEVLARRPNQVRVTMPETDRVWLEDYTAHLREVIGSSDGVDVVGELADLTPLSFSATAASDTAELPPAAVTSALAETVIDLLVQQAADRAAARAGRRRARGDSGSSGPDDAAPVSQPAGTETAAVRRLVCRAAGKGRRLARRVVSRLRG